jgi:predicted metal-dependent phosphoesterase TrpH
MSLDLHLHTYHSDGRWSPTEVVEHAVKMKLKHIAITDHDTVCGIKEAQEAAGDRLEIIPGIEINTVWQDNEGRRHDIHILGYFIDTNSTKLHRFLERQREARQEHAQECVRTLVAAGVPISMETVRQHAGKGAIGKLHLTQAILAVGAAKDANEAYDKYLARDSKYFVERKSATPEEAIAAINDANGIASIAHPGKEDFVMPLILNLKTKGLRAIEAYHRIHSQDRVRQFVRFAKRNDMLLTGGSDCHGPFKEYKATIGTVPVPIEVLSKLRQAANLCAAAPMQVS